MLCETIFLLVMVTFQREIPKDAEIASWTDRVLINKSCIINRSIINRYFKNWILRLFNLKSPHLLPWHKTQHWVTVAIFASISDRSMCISWTSEIILMGNNACICKWKKESYAAWSIASPKLSNNSMTFNLLFLTRRRGFMTRQSKVDYMSASLSLYRAVAGCKTLPSRLYREGISISQGGYLIKILKYNKLYL